jgi:hypothetical protein
VQFRFDRHARRRLKLYGISTLDVERLLEEPDHVTSDPDNPERVQYWKRTDSGWLRAIVVVEPLEAVVLSIHPRRKGPVN